MLTGQQLMLANDNHRLTKTYISETFGFGARQHNN